MRPKLSPCCNVATNNTNYRVTLITPALRGSTRRALANAIERGAGDRCNEPMGSPQELAGWYADAWNETDPARRRELLERSCSPNVRFLQEGWEQEVVGIDALDATIAEFQAGWPPDIEVRVELTTPVDSHHGFGRGGFVWIFGDDRGYATDFAELGGDGKMKTIVVFGDPGPPPPRD